MIDIVLGTAGCLATLPVAAVVKLSYLAADDTHPIFYKQTRVGLRGQCFELWKLRSMAWDADEQLQRLLEDPAVRAEWEQNQKLAHVSSNPLRYQQSAESGTASQRAWYPG